ncbi:MAG: hypothetical protein VX272_00800, partial [Planctomycetota bacterium]|nr:hypothetical protein [Planctomycetota bacterium]
LLSDEDLLEVESEDEDSGGEISEEELDSLLSEADSPAEDDGGAEPAELSSDELDALLADDETEDATDVLSEDDQPPELPDVPDSLPEDIGSEIEEEVPELEDDGGSDTDVGTEMVLDESEEDDTGSSRKKGFKAPKKSKGFASKEGSAKPKKSVSPVPAKASGGKRLDFICSECYSVLALSATYSEDIVTCPECFHVGKKPDDSFLRTVSTAKAGEGKKALVLTLLSCLMIICFSGIVFLNSAYGDAASMTEANTEASSATARTVDEEGAEVEAEDFVPATEDKEFVDLWRLILLCSGSVFLLLLIWQACVYEGNRWEAYF